MDDAALSALRLSIEVGLAEARRELARRHDELAERRAALEQSERTRAHLLAERARWEARVRGLSGHILTGRELAGLGHRGEALEQRVEESVRRHQGAREAVARAERRLEEGRRAVGEQLARQRWIDQQAHQGRVARERQAASRDDED